MEILWVLAIPPVATLFYIGLFDKEIEPEMRFDVWVIMSIVFDTIILACFGVAHIIELMKG